MRPVGIPEWANTLTNIVEPPQGKKDTGHVEDEMPSAGFENWLKNKLAEYARETGNAGFSQVQGAFISASQDSSYIPTSMANSIKYGTAFSLFINDTDVWIITNTNGTYEVVADPHSKSLATNYEHGDLPGSADDVAITGVIFNEFFEVWIVVGQESSQAPYTAEPKIAHTIVQFPTLSAAWTAVNVGFAIDLLGLDYSTVTGTTIAVGTSGTILRSTDGGDVWGDVSPGGDLLRGMSVYSAKSSVNPARGEFVVMGTDASDELVGLFSDDDGLTWTYINVSGLLSQPTLSIADVAHNGRVWIALNGGAPNAEILTSADGLNWSAIVVPAAFGPLEPHLAADEAGGLVFLSSGYYSDTDGQTWKSWTSFRYPDSLTNGDEAPESFQLITLSATGQIGLANIMNDRAVAWFTPKQVMRNASYDNPDI